VDDDGNGASEWWDQIRVTIEVTSRVSVAIANVTRRRRVGWSARRAKSELKVGDCDVGRDEVEKKDCWMRCGPDLASQETRR
jgi:hypothetical protein